MNISVCFLLALCFVPLVQNSQTEPSFIDIAFLVDYDMHSKFEFNTEKLNIFLNGVFKKAQEIYRPLNIYLRYVGIFINNEQWSYSYRPIQDLIYNFMLGQKFEYFKDIEHDILLVLSGSDFNKTVSAGEASGYDICTNHSVAAVRYINQSKENFILTFVHEIGHLLGLPHEEPSCECSALKRQCIMVNGAKFTGDYIWSGCSKKSIYSQLETCRKTLNESAVSVYPVCGNAIVEENELCDCAINDTDCLVVCSQKDCVFKPVVIEAKAYRRRYGKTTNLKIKHG